jgi:hypothetical protein
MTNAFRLNDEGRAFDFQVASGNLPEGFMGVFDGAKGIYEQ